MREARYQMPPQIKNAEPVCNTQNCGGICGRPNMPECTSTVAGGAQPAASTARQARYRAAAPPATAKATGRGKKMQAKMMWNRYMNKA